MTKVFAITKSEWLQLRDTSPAFENVEKEITRLVEAGGKIIFGPFDINIGKCAVVSDPWKNQYCILDLTKGTYVYKIR